jgi:transcription initiation factor TFIIIB Brf1 subunit/transcription initiation factor TFIIB
MASVRRTKIPRYDSSFPPWLGVELEKLLAKLRLPPDVKQRVDNLFRRIKPTAIVLNHDVRVILAACFYFACRQHNPRDVHEIAFLTTLSVKDIEKCAISISSALDLNYALVKEDELLDRLCDDLGLDIKRRSVVRHFVREAKCRGLVRSLVCL